MDEARFIDVEGARLLAYLHRADAAHRPALGAVVCGAFGDEHVATHRMERALALELAQAGVPVLRFDPRGLGDSEGDLGEATPERGLADLERAIGELVEGTGVARVGLVGVRLGSCLAALAAERRPVAFLAALAPVLSPRRYFQRLLRRQVLSDAMYGAEVEGVEARLAALQAGSVLDVGGYPLSPAFHEGYCAIDFAGIVEKLEAPVWVGLPAGPARDAERLRGAGSRGAAGPPEVVTSEDPPFWEFPIQGSVVPVPGVLVERLVRWVAARGDDDSVPEAP